MEWCSAEKEIEGRKREKKKEERDKEKEGKERREEGREKMERGGEGRRGQEKRGGKYSLPHCNHYSNSM